LVFQPVPPHLEHVVLASPWPLQLPQTGILAAKIEAELSVNVLDIGSKAEVLGLHS
jgi:hypothetical protein